MRRAIMLLCGLLVAVNMSVFKDSFKMYGSDHFKYMGKFIGSSRSKSNTHYRLRAKYKRPIENLNSLSSQNQEPKDTPNSLVYDLFIYLTEDKYFSADATDDCQARRNLARQRRTFSVSLDGQYSFSSQIHGDLGRSPTSKYWYFVVADCQAQNYKKYALLPKLEVEIDVRGNGNTHFSLQEGYTLWIYMAAFVLTLLAFGWNIKAIISDFRSESFSFWDEWDQNPQFLIFFSIGSLLLAVFLKLIHLIVFAQNGVGITAFEVIAVMGDITSQTITGLVLLLLAYGWTIRQSKAEDMELFIPVFIVLLLVNIAVASLTFVNRGSASKYQDFSGVQGWILVFFRICQHIGFVVGCWLSKKDVEHRQIKGFFGKIFWSGSAYLLSFPIMMIISSLCSNTWQQCTMQFGMLLFSIGSIGVMLREFSGRGDYYKASVRSQSILPNKWE